MLMAAGLGTRLRPFTDLEPKALMPLMGIPMAQFALDLLAQQGVTHVVANIHHHAESARAGLLGLDRGGMNLEISDESDQLLGSAGGLKKAMSIFRETGPQKGTAPFFLLNADVLIEADLKGLAARHARLRSAHGVKLTLMVFEGVAGQGEYREIGFDRATGLMTHLGPLSSGKPFFAGAAVIEPDALDRVPASGPADFVESILRPALEEGKVGTFFSGGLWHDIGSPRLWLEAHLALLRLLEKETPRCWADRLQSLNKRIAPEVWVAREPLRPLNTDEWVGPAYWNPLRDETTQVPRWLGPRAVLYGVGSAERSYRDGIGFRSIWVT